MQWNWGWGKGDPPLPVPSLRGSSHGHGRDFTPSGGPWGRSRVSLGPRPSSHAGDWRGGAGVRVVLRLAGASQPGARLRASPARHLAEPGCPWSSAASGMQPGQFPRGSCTGWDPLLGGAIGITPGKILITAGFQSPTKRRVAGPAQEVQIISITDILVTPVGSRIT